MADKFDKTLSVAIQKLMQPLVRILLRNGVAYGTLAELVRKAYVDVAFRDFAPRGKKQTVSRVSALTGLTRKEVSRLLETGDADVMLEQARYNRAIRVISGWRNDSHFHDATGKPATLPLEGEKKSFARLVRQYSGDIPTKAMLTMLQEAGSVNVSNQAASLVRNAYVPGRDAADKIEILGVDVCELVSTIDHNLVATPDNLRFQRKVAYDNVDPAAVAKLRKLSFKKAQALLEQLDHQFAAHELEEGSEQQGKYISLGIYFYEQDS
ncbi:MAG TPA: DUF6502 family protein [Gammaproteobacteria bacterium]|nr:DUF6502 family protein [Gammaproteobacteria bacterium]